MIYVPALAFNQGKKRKITVSDLDLYSRDGLVALYDFKMSGCSCKFWFLFNISGTMSSLEYMTLWCPHVRCLYILAKTKSQDFLTNTATNAYLIILLYFSNWREHPHRYSIRVCDLHILYVSGKSHEASEILPIKQ